MKQSTISAMEDIFRKKNHDYNNSAHRSFCRFGPVSLIVRIGDKLERLEGLARSQGSPQVAESTADTALDAANYLVMLAAELLWGQGLEREVLLSDQEDRGNIPVTLSLFPMLASLSPDKSAPAPAAQLQGIYNAINERDTDKAISLSMTLAGHMAYWYESLKEEEEEPHA